MIAASGRLDGASVPLLDRPLTDALDQGHRDLVLDLHMLHGLDPDGVGVLWAALRAASRRGGTLTVAGLSPALQPVLDPLVPHGLRVRNSLLAALSATHDEPDPPS